MMHCDVTSECAYHPYFYYLYYLTSCSFVQEMLISAAWGWRIFLGNAEQQRKTMWTERDFCSSKNYKYYFIP